MTPIKSVFIGWRTKSHSGQVATELEDSDTHTPAKSAILLRSSRKKLSLQNLKYLVKYRPSETKFYHRTRGNYCDSFWWVLTEKLLILSCFFCTNMHVVNSKSGNFSGTLDVWELICYTYLLPLFDFCTPLAPYCILFPSSPTSPRLYLIVCTFIMGKMMLLFLYLASNIYSFGFDCIQ